jgi:nitrogen fixation NifU-like protein
MSDLTDLYQEVILDHSRHPHNFGPLVGADHEAKGYNPLCGDQVTIHLKMEGDLIEDIHFEGNGCAISKSSASVMTDAVKGKHKPEVQALFSTFQKMVTGHADPSAPVTDATEKLAVFSGVSEFPTRVKCAVLAWHTLKSALEGEKKNVSTEGIHP